MKKDRIGILFGGRSAEHEISILSASFVMDMIDPSRHEIVKIGIAKDGSWFRIGAGISGLRSLEDPRMSAIIPSGINEAVAAEPVSPSNVLNEIDFAFPVLHGPYGEDGTIQGFFEMADIPYAGCGVASSAVTMDKIFSKQLLQNAGLPVMDYVNVLRRDLLRDEATVIADIEEKLGYPVFVKPANMGSSVGVSRACDRAELETALRSALKHDERIIVESSCFGRELEAAVLGNDKPEAATSIGEITYESSFYDYDAKYRDGAAELIIPAEIDKSLRDEILELAIRAYNTLGGSGYSRVDFFLDEQSGKPIINEMNSIPGFTQYSMFPSLWKASGLDAKELIERIIELGYERYNVKNSR